MPRPVDCHVDNISPFADPAFHTLNRQEPEVEVRFPHVTWLARQAAIKAVGDHLRHPDLLQSPEMVRLETLGVAATRKDKT